MGGLRSGKRHLCQYRLQIWCVQRSITLPEESRLSSVIPKRQGGSIFPDARNEDVIREISPETGKMLTDISPDQIAAAQARCAEFAWVDCRETDIAAPPYGNAEFDAVFAVQALEYLSDLDGALRHIHRMLRSGGRLIVVATDWSSAVWHSEDAPRMQRVLTAWAPHTPRRDLPGILAARLRRAGIQP